MSSQPVTLTDISTLSDSQGVSLGVQSPNGLTRLGLQTRLQNHFQNTQYYQGNDWNDSIQDGLDEVCAFSGCLLNSGIIPFTPYTTYYDMLTLFPDYIGVYAIFNTTINRWMFSSSIRKFYQVRIDWETAAGVPYYFSPISHRFVSIFKKPIVEGYGNMIVYYRSSAPTLNDGTIIPLPDDQIFALESYCIQDLWEQNQEFGKAAEYFDTYVKNLEALRIVMQNQRNGGRVVSLR